MKQLVETLRCCSHQAFAVTPDVKRAFETVEPFDLHGELHICGLSCSCRSVFLQEVVTQVVDLPMFPPSSKALSLCIAATELHRHVLTPCIPCRRGPAVDSAQAHTA